MENFSDNIKNQTPFTFLLSAIKPYKWYYLLMMQAPFANGIYSLLYNYAIKLIIDSFATAEIVAIADIFWPIVLFIFSCFYLEISWRIHNFAAWKTMPYLMQDIMNAVNNYVFNHSYNYFQNSLGGAITSKIKGINDGAQKIHNAFEFNVSNPTIMTVFTGIALAIVNLQLFLVVLIFVIIQGCLAIAFGRVLNKIEQDKENIWHSIIGNIADNIANVFTIFAHGRNRAENSRIDQIYCKKYIPTSLKWHKIDFIMSCIMGACYVCLMIVLLFYLIYLKNHQQISVGDIAFVFSLTYIFSDSSWKMINAIKDFTKDVANFRSSFSIMQITKNPIDKADAKELVI